MFRIDIAGHPSLTRLIASSSFYSLKPTNVSGHPGSRSTCQAGPGYITMNNTMKIHKAQHALSDSSPRNYVLINWKIILKTASL
jgi:hypothetical protein